MAKREGEARRNPTSSPGSNFLSLLLSCFSPSQHLGCPLKFALILFSAAELSPVTKCFVLSSFQFTVILAWCGPTLSVGFLLVSASFTSWFSLSVFSKANSHLWTVRSILPFYPGARAEGWLRDWPPLNHSCMPVTSLVTPTWKVVVGYKAWPSLGNLGHRAVVEAVSPLSG